MLTELTFRRNQVRAVGGLMDLDESFRPDDRTPEEVAQMLADGDAANDAYVEHWTNLNFARGAAEMAREELHEACVVVTLALRSAYRKDAVSLAAIRRLPSRD